MLIVPVPYQLAVRRIYCMAHAKYNKLVITWLFSYCTCNTALGLGSRSCNTALGCASCCIELLDPAPRAVLRVQYEQPCNNYYIQCNTLAIKNEVLCITMCINIHVHVHNNYYVHININHGNLYCGSIF